MKHIHTQDFSYTVRMLDIEDLANILLLQETIYKTLPEDQKNFIIPKSAEQFCVRLNGQGHMIGAYYGPQLIGYGAVAFAKPYKPIADMVIDPAKVPYKSEELAVLQSSVVDPAFRKQGVHFHMLQAELEICQEYGKTHVMGEVAATNTASLKSFLKIGMAVQMAGTDPVDACPLLFLHKKIAAVPVYEEKPAYSFMLPGIMAQLNDYLSHGLSGTGLLFSPEASGPQLQLHALAL